MFVLDMRVVVLVVVVFALVPFLFFCTIRRFVVFVFTTHSRRKRNIHSFPGGARIRFRWRIRQTNKINTDRNADEWMCAQAGRKEILNLCFYDAGKSCFSCITDITGNAKPLDVI